MVCAHHYCMHRSNSNLIWDKNTKMDLNHLNSSTVTITTFLILIFLTCAFKLLNWAWFRPNKLEKLLRKQGLNGNPYKLVVGDAIQFMSTVKSEQSKTITFSDDLPYHIMPYFKQTIEKHGDNAFIWLGPTPTLLVTDPHMIKEILTKPDIFKKPVPDPIGETLVGGLLYLEGEKWAHHKKVINPAFRIEKLKDMTSLIRLSCSNTMDKWEAMVSEGGESGTEIDVWSYFPHLSGDMISRTAFGSTHEQGRIIFELQKEQMELVLQNLSYYFVPGLRHLPTKASRKIKANCKEIKSLLAGIISQREKKIEKGETTNNDLLGMLMESNYKEIQESGGKNLSLSVDDVIEECKLFYFAGSDTTSTLLTWTMVLLGKHQEWQARAREEVLNIFGKKQPDFDDIYRLKIVTMILQEVLRLYPPVPLLMRALVETTKLGKFTLPVGTNLFLPIALLHHDPRIWGNDVKEFKPERFSDGISSAAKVPFSFIPFSAGPRMCIGQHLTMVEAKVALAMILQRFTFELSPSYQHAPFAILTLQPKYSVPLLFKRIQHN